MKLEKSGSINIEVSSSITALDARLKLVETVSGRLSSKHTLRFAHAIRASHSRDFDTAEERRNSGIAASS